MALKKRAIARVVASFMKWGPITFKNKQCNFIGPFFKETFFGGLGKQLFLYSKVHAFC